MDKSVCDADDSWKEIEEIMDDIVSLNSCTLCKMKRVEKWILGPCSHPYCKECVQKVKDKCMDCDLPFNKGDIMVDKMVTFMQEWIVQFREAIKDDIAKEENITICSSPPKRKATKKDTNTSRKNQKHDEPEDMPFEENSRETVKRPLPYIQDLQQMLSGDKGTANKDNGNRSGTNKSFRSTTPIFANRNVEGGSDNCNPSVDDTDLSSCTAAAGVVLKANTRKSKTKLEFSVSLETTTKNNEMEKKTCDSLISSAKSRDVQTTGKSSKKNVRKSKACSNFGTTSPRFNHSNDEIVSDEVSKKSKSPKKSLSSKKSRKGAKKSAKRSDESSTDVDDVSTVTRPSRTSTRKRIPSLKALQAHEIPTSGSSNSTIDEAPPRRKSKKVEETASPTVTRKVNQGSVTPKHASIKKEFTPSPDITLSQALKSIKSFDGPRSSLDMIGEKELEVKEDKEVKENSPQSDKTTRERKSKDTSLSKRNIKGETPLMVAIIKGDTETAKKLLESDVDVNVKDNAGWTPLHEACYYGRHEIVELLIKKGAAVNLPGSENITALHEAVQNYHLDVVRVLVRYGADINARDSKGKTPRDYNQTDDMKRALETERSADCSLLNTSLNMKPSVVKEVLAYKLNKEQNKMLSGFVKKFKVKQSKKMRAEVSHVILDTDDQNLVEESTMYHLAILYGKWIVSAKWLEKSLEAGEIQDPEAYEVSGSEMYPLDNAPAKGRQNKNSQMPPLFDGCNFYVKDVAEGRHEIIDLINAGGGILLNREPTTKDIHSDIITVPFHAQPESDMAETCYIIVHPDNKPPPLRYSMTEMKSLPVSWLKECIETFSFADPKPYLSN